MSYFINVVPIGYEEFEAELNVSGNLSNFYEFLDARDVDQGTNGEGTLTVTVEKVKSFLATENRFPGKNTGETLLREFLADVIDLLPPETPLNITCL